MYERFYRLRERPFALTPDPEYLYPSRVHKEALSYLRYGLESHAGFVAITGAIGSGKTTMLQTLVRGLDNQTTVARVMNTLLDPRELIEAAMIDLGLDASGKSKPVMLKEFGEFLVTQRAAGRLVLLVIDEAQNLSLQALEEVRMLSNLETEKSKLLQIILIGQPDLRDKLNRPELEQLRQRITVSYHLEPLDAEETARYINHRLGRASIGAPLEFPRGATDLIHERSGGVPRLINVIADATLVFGYGEERPEIDRTLVLEVISDLDATGVLGPRTAAEPQAPAPAVVPAAAVPAIAAPVPATTRTAAALDQHAHELATREQQLRRHEQELATRERDFAEQQRILADQQRILRHAAAQAADVRPRVPSPTTARLSSQTLPGHARPAQPAARPYRYVRGRTARPGFWRRVKDVLFGNPEPILEDSL